MLPSPKKIAPMPDLDDQHLPPPPLLTPDTIGDGAVNIEEGEGGEQLRILSRSPHPYHRQNFELLHPSDTFMSRGSGGRSSSRRGSASTSGRPVKPPPPRAAASSRRESPHPSTSPSPSPSASTSSYRLHPPFAKVESTPTSDSGTDADDEHFLKGLPAPKTRLHKGLRGRNEPLSGTSTPLLSPALLEEEGRRDSATVAGGAKAVEASLRDRRAVAERSRRKKEIIRRATELLIVFSLGAILYSKRDVKPFVHAWSRELIAQAVLAFVLVALYPIRAVLWAYQRGTPSKRLPLSIPASFDPAPIFYPTTIPLYVSLLLAPTNRLVILPNLVLSLASLPKQLIPLAPTGELCSPVHWLVCTLPLAISSLKSPQWGQGRLEAISIRETAVLLYPLHQNLCMLLHRLTTTSLLPAELQLLSVALINLLLLSRSPQMIILKTLLWGGGLGLLIFCGHVIRRGVALARVPKWRFRRVSPGSSRASLPYRLLSLLVPLGRPRYDSFTAAAAAEHSDSECCSLSEDGDPSHHRANSGSANGGDRKSLDSAPPGSLLHASTFNGEIEPLTLSPDEDGFESLLNVPNPAAPVGKNGAVRRHTLPSLASIGARSKTHTPSGRRKRSASTSIRAFFSLTQAEATLRKWMYAVWVYVCIIVLVLVVLRSYIGTYALGGQELLGWGLGYMFGDLPWFRLQVVKANLERWVCLPARPSFEAGDAGSCSLGWVEHFRHHVFGEANTRLILSAYWATIIVMGLAVVFKLTPIYEVDTRRKVFHFTMVGILIPATYVDPTFAAFALTIILAAFLLLDLIRASQLPPLSKPIASFLTPYVDGRDLRGPVVISHIFLLIGCSIPLWLSLAALGRTGDATLAGWEVPTRDVSMLSGVVCVGLGDAAASLIGRRWGHRKWVWGGGKSLEGSVAFAVAVFLGLIGSGFWLRVGGWPITGEGLRGHCDAGGGGLWQCAWGWTRDWKGWTRSVRGAAVCGSMASLTEAVLTGGNDNVVVPVVLWTCVKSLGV